MLDYLRVNVDSGHRRIHWGRPQVEQTRSAGADQNYLALDIFLRNLPGQHLGGRNIRCLVEVAELEIHPARAIGWHFNIADADVVEASGLAERRLTTRV